VFDRSWYGRVLVERVEGIASRQEWQRGYEEINQFERMLVADGVRIVKCFLHITPAEQIRRFKDRLANPLKRWKLSYEDLRNRARWTDYERFGITEPCTPGKIPELIFLLSRFAPSSSSTITRSWTMRGHWRVP
jgi:Polyphosphate kinase 2 (PPK2)